MFSFVFIQHLLPFVCWREDSLRTLQNFRKSHKAEKREESHSAEKVRTFCSGILVKKLAHTHGFEHEPSGLKSKHLTTRPGTPELCDLRAETRELSREKKAPALSHNTCLSQV